MMKNFNEMTLEEMMSVANLISGKVKEKKSDIIKNELDIIIAALVKLIEVDKDTYYNPLGNMSFDWGDLLQEIEAIRRWY